MSIVTITLWQSRYCIHGSGINIHVKIDWSICVACEHVNFNPSIMVAELIKEFQVPEIPDYGEPG